MTTPPPPSFANTAAVIVTYHPDDALADRLARIAAQVHHLIIVDNRSTDPVRDRLRHLAHTNPHLTLILNDENLGIATAFNQGLRHIIAANLPFALLFDQDTIVDANLLPTLADVYQQLPDPARLAVLAANHRPAVAGLPTAPAPTDAPFHAVTTAISSGSLIPTAAFADLGPFRDDFFIDSVDHEFCLRALAHHYHVYQTTAPLMTHPMGNAQVHRLIGLTRTCHHYPPIRHYYIARNRATLIRTYARRQPRWTLHIAYALLINIIHIIAFEKHKPQKLAAIAKGLTHAIGFAKTP